MQRFFLKSENFSGEKIIIKTPDVIYQMQRVLRMKNGDQFIALDNSGYEYLCVLSNLDKSSAAARIIEKRNNGAESEISVILYQALPKKMEIFEWILKKGTELGVSAFVPLITERTERREMTKRDRPEKILREAAEQSERGKIPILKEPIDFEKAVTENFDGISIILHSRGNWPSLASKLPEIARAKKCRIFIGPEGGFLEKEIEQAQKSGFLVASLGPRILRTETAAIVAVGIILLSY